MSEKGAVRDIEERQRRDRHGRSIGSRSRRNTPAATTALADGADGLDRGTLSFWIVLLWARKAPRWMFSVMTTDPVGVRGLVVEGEADKLSQSVFRRQVLEGSSARSPASGDTRPPARRRRALPCCRSSSRSSACWVRRGGGWRRPSAPASPFSENAARDREDVGHVRSGSFVRDVAPRASAHRRCGMYCLVHPTVYGPRSASQRGRPSSPLSRFATSRG